MTAMAANSPQEKVLFDFSNGTAPWPSIDDRVMGGRSVSRMRMDNGVAVFEGNVTLANNGGFASLRSRSHNHQLRGYDGLVLRVRGDGKRYSFRLRTNRSLDGVSYQAPLMAMAGGWSEVWLKFSDFQPVFHGRRVRDYPPLDPSSIQTYGIIISQKQTGPFRLEIDWIKAFPNER